MARRKIYTIEITEGHHWYADKKGRKYQAQLKAKETVDSGHNQVPAFQVSESPFFFINPLHCKVVAESILEA